MFAIGNEEMKDLPDLGDTITCPHCGETHKVIYGKQMNINGEWEAVKSTAASRCKGKLWLCGVNGKNITRRWK